MTDAAQGNPRRSAIREIYAMVQAPVWVSPNLDGLADVLRDLSWLPVGPVTLRWQPPSELPAADRDEIAEVLRRAVAETAGTARPVSVPGVSAG